MAHDEKLGTVLDEFGKLGHDEPVFVIRAKDKSAPAAIRAYANVAREAGADDSHVRAARAVAAGFEEWQHRNPALVKCPD